MSEHGSILEHSRPDATVIFARPAGGKPRRAVILAILGVWILLVLAWIALRNSSAWQYGQGHPAHNEAAESSPPDATPPDPPTDASYAYLGAGKVRLGQFAVRVFDSATRTALLSEFRLEAETQFARDEDFARFMAGNRRGLQEQVMVTLRACTVPQLRSSDTAPLEKKLVGRFNRAFGRPLFDAIRIKDYTLFEAVGDSPFVRCAPGDG